MCLKERLDFALAHRIGNCVTQLRVDDRARKYSVPSNAFREHPRLVGIRSIILPLVQDERWCPDMAYLRQGRARSKRTDGSIRLSVDVGSHLTSARNVAASGRRRRVQ